MNLLHLGKSPRRPHQKLRFGRVDADGIRRAELGTDATADTGVVVLNADATLIIKGKNVIGADLETAGTFARHPGIDAPISHQSDTKGPVNWWHNGSPSISLTIYTRRRSS
jgi:hypothetical protein